MGRKKTDGRPAGKDYINNLRKMQLVRVIELSENNGHICEEMPICRHPAVVTLVFTHEIVNLCADAYKRYRGKK